MASSTSFHVQGPALLTFSGSALGYSEDGVDIEETLYHRDAMNDVFGPSAPADTQTMLSIAIISVALVSYDQDVIDLAKALAKASNAPGTMPQAGILLGAGGFLRPLSIAGSLDQPYNYPTVHLIHSATAKIGTVRTMQHLTFRAIAFANNSDSSAGAVLYTRG